MAEHWLSSCKLGELIVNLADMMTGPNLRNKNYSLRVLKEPIKENALKALQEPDAQRRKMFFLSNLSLEDVIKVLLNKNNKNLELYAWLIKYN